MKFSTIVFHDESRLKQHIVEHGLAHQKALFVQFFDGRNNKQLFEEMASLLSTLLPQATILGSSTAGEIFEGKMYETSVVISFCLFTKTALIPLFSPSCDFNSGTLLAQKLSSPSIKAAIFFSEGLAGEPEAFLQGIHSLKPELTIAGGAAADYGTFSQTLISLNGTVYEHGVVGVAFENDSLKIYNAWKLNWNPIGKPLHVTKADKNILYELDGKPILEVIEHYFGADVVKNLPSSIVKFPLIKVENGVHIARAPVGLSENALIFAGHFKNNETVRFGIANIDSLIDTLDSILQYKPEALWIYSCMGRKAFADKILEHEFRLFNDIVGTSSGFFTYGEFFKTPQSSQMLNLTTTIFALSEENEPKELNSIHTISLDEAHQNMAIMSRLTNAIVSELEQTIKTLDTYKIALDANSIVSKTDTNGIITYVNDLFVKISGFTKDELIGKSHRLIKHPDVPNAIYQDLWQTILSGKVWKGMMTNQTKSGEAYYVDTTIIPLFDEKHNIVEFISTRTDLTKIINQRQQIQRQTTDELTKLPNRIKLFEDIEVLQNPHIALFNINSFGEINRFYGFEIGNAVLKEFAYVLGEVFTNAHYKLYKLSADNFAIVSTEEKIETFCSHIKKAIIHIHQHEFLADTQGILSRVTVGIATNKTQLLSRAEEALKQARVRNVDWFLSTEQEEAIHLQNFQMLNTLKKAIENDRITPYYQAIVSLETGLVQKYESLIRLIDEEGKVHSPAFFLDIAKKSKYYSTLTRIMIQKTLKDFEKRTESISINLSAEDIEDEKTVSFIKNSIVAFPNPSRITFELTETEAIKDYYSITNFIQSLKTLNVQIAIDDFGSGYSNFAYLAQFNAHFLKIDGTLIKRIVTDANVYQIVAAINNFAKKLGMQTVAEFVSDSEINEMVKALKIDFAQGYFYAKPLPIDKL